jgi:hypothetical protein
MRCGREAGETRGAITMPIPAGSAGPSIVAWQAEDILR